MLYLKCYNLFKQLHQQKLVSSNLCSISLLENLLDISEVVSEVLSQAAAGDICEGEVLGYMVNTELNTFFMLQHLSVSGAKNCKILNYFLI